MGVYDKLMKNVERRSIWETVFELESIRSPGDAISGCCNVEKNVERE
jgi:hypothetical protein